MSDDTTPSSNPPEQPNPFGSATTSAPAGPLPAGGSRPVLDKSEIEAGKVMALLVYAIGFFIPLFWIVPFVTRDNRFSLYHAKQGLLLCIIGFGGGVVLQVLTLILAAVTAGIGACLGLPLFGVFMLGYLALNIIGLINAINGQVKPLPVIGLWAERWFASIDIKPKMS